MGHSRSIGARLQRLWAGPVAAALIASMLIVPSAAIASDPLPVAPGHAKTGVGTAGPSGEVATQTTSQFGTGDVFVAVGNGQIQWRHPDGTLNGARGDPSRSSQA